MAFDKYRVTNSSGSTIGPVHWVSRCCELPNNKMIVYLLTLDVELTEERRVKELASELWKTFRVAQRGAAARVRVVCLRGEGSIRGRLAVELFDFGYPLAATELLGSLHWSVLVSEQVSALGCVSKQRCIKKGKEGR